MGRSRRRRRKPNCKHQMDSGENQNNEVKKIEGGSGEKTGKKKRGKVKNKPVFIYTA